jgi:outer membrane protein OmpA-like peptidoglycan-associated protein
MPNRISTLALVGTLFVSSAAMAQGFDAQTYHPSPNTSNAHWSQPSAITPAHLEWGAGLSFNYASNVLVQRNSEGENVHSPVASLLTLNVLGSIGLTGDLDIGLDVPLHLVMSGDSAAADTDFIEVEGGFGIGDVRLLPRYRFYSSGFDGVRAGVHLAGELGVVLPTGDSDNFQGGGFQLAPRFLATLANNTASSLTVSFGYLMREASYFEAGELEVDDALTWGIGFTTGVSDSFSFVGDVHGEIGYASVSTGTEPHPIEGLIGGQVHLDNLDVNIGVGRGLSHGFGVAGFRGVLAVSYRKATDLDRDGDDILNTDDSCPDEAEDFDRYEDEDGCPEPDNDGDGVLDRPDRCDNEAEDIDGFEDEDGCPDPDNDADGILDVDDSCPDEAEDIDLFEDEDGCPEEDNDGDGVLDGDDACVSSAEDMDGFEDEDGCPELDNDRDAILDEDDVCPLEAEVVNGVDDEDGCAEPSRIHLDRRGGAITIIEDMDWFDDSTSSLTNPAFTALNQIAVALNAYPDLNLRIVIRSRDRSGEPSRLGISTRRVEAIQRALVNDGVDVGRIEISPYAFATTDTDGPGYEVELRIAP